MNTVCLRKSRIGAYNVKGAGHKELHGVEKALFNLLIDWQRKYDHLTVAEILYVLEGATVSVKMTLLKNIIEQNTDV